MRERLERFFGIEAADSTVRREVVGGLATFAAMSLLTLLRYAFLDH